ncbi:hypothetical protein L1987_21143 [Smallanthus sonchifolius]|uniref:Uncharacterized protein n=1 Tax=Smallanthus sonchifolius TaxID=185202 RepID=A0ACB9IV90_9ASTR|nr:hypothetical protein L1987_21143 [Smallanthus sonchifolius]
MQLVEQYSYWVYLCVHSGHAVQSLTTHTRTRKASAQHKHFSDSKSVTVDAQISVRFNVYLHLTRQVDDNLYTVMS